MRRALTIIGIAIAATVMVPAVAQAHARAIDGVCGVHRGRLVLRNQGHEEYHVRFGVKRGHVGGSHHCRGHYLKRVHSRTSGSVLDWHPFDLPSWNWSGIADVATQGAVTVGTCGALAMAVTSELPSAGAATVIIAGATGGCIKAVTGLYKTRNDFAFMRR